MNTFYIVAGEASGDRHGAELLRELKANYAAVRFLGVGGRHLRAAGQEQLFDLAGHAVVGVTDVLLNYGKFRRFFNEIISDLQSHQPEALILVDFPGFNLRLAERARRLFPKMKIIYYISPQVWAWKAGRSKKMARLLDLLLVIFPFEEHWFAKREPSLKTVWVGHPILDRWKPQEEAPACLEVDHRVVLMPGSRQKEIRTHLPILLKTAKILAQTVPNLKFQILTHDAQLVPLFTKIIERCKAVGLNLQVSAGYQLTHLSRADLALVASGTATLECALAGLPMLVVYKANPLTYFIGRRLVHLEFISIVNLIAGRKVVPEYLQDRADPQILAESARQILIQPQLAGRMREELRSTVAKLGEPGANARAVAEIKKLCPAQ